MAGMNIYSLLGMAVFVTVVLTDPSGVRAVEPLPVAKTYAFRAKLVDSETGEPIKGVRLYSRLKAEWSAVSDEDGELTLNGVPAGRLELKVSSEKTGYCRWWSGQTVDPMERNISRLQLNFNNLFFEVNGNVGVAKIFLEKGVKISGKVIDPVGTPVADATVDAVKGGSSLSGDSRFSVHTNAEGYYEIILPASGEADYNLMAHDGVYVYDPKIRACGGTLQTRKWANGVISAFKSKPGQHFENMDIRLGKPCVITGRVTNKKGMPMANHEVQALSTDQSQSTLFRPVVKTNGEGFYKIEFASEGAHYVQPAPAEYLFYPGQTPQVSSTLALVETKSESPVSNVNFTIIDPTITILRNNPEELLPEWGPSTGQSLTKQKPLKQDDIHKQFAERLIQAMEAQERSQLRALFCQDGVDENWINQQIDTIMKRCELFADIEIFMQLPEESGKAENPVPSWNLEVTAVCILHYQGPRKTVRTSASRFINRGRMYLYLGQKEGRLYIASQSPTDPVL
jgi:hypothetical protein